MMGYNTPYFTKLTSLVPREYYSTFLLILLVVVGYVSVIFFLASLMKDETSNDLGFRTSSMTENKEVDSEIWTRFGGICSDSDDSDVPSIFYIQSQVIGASNCLGVCARVKTCIGFSLKENGECLVISRCQVLQKQSKFITYIKKELAKKVIQDQLLKTRSSLNKVKGKNDCSYCPPQNQCEEPRMCWSGRCFNGLPLADGHPCEDGDPDTDNVCVKGSCVTIQELFKKTEDRSPLMKKNRRKSLKAFQLQESTKCNYEYSVALYGADAETCSRECLREPHKRCQAFSLETNTPRRCLLFEQSTHCSSFSKGWLTGVKNFQS
eukprot:m.334673 g.334673  ORF g.334673 m.334673 type:complete len:322 (-) comp17409_c0_seq1:799-1764(-)